MATRIPSFTAVAPVPDETVEAWHGRVPDALLDVWQSQGLGSGVDGFIKVIDPGVYLEQMGDCLPSRSMVPVLATGMADVIVWDTDAQKLRVLLYRFGMAEALFDDLDFVAMLLSDRDFLDERLRFAPYAEAVDRYGAPSYTQCFGYVPILALGGPQSVENLEKMELTTHVELITQLAGPIPY